MQTADERSVAIGYPSARNAFVLLSAMLLGLVVAELIQSGTTRPVAAELTLLVLGQVVYFGSGA